MGSTSGGLPYPEGTAKVRDGDNDIKALADAMQAKLDLSAVACELTHSVAQNIPNSVDTAVTFDTEYFDTGDLHAAGSPTRITVPTGGAGVWLFTFNICFTANATGARGVYLRVNANSADRRVLGYTAGASWDSTLAGSHVCRLVAGDYMELMAYQSSGAALALKGSNSASHLLAFSAARIGN